MNNSTTYRDCKVCFDKNAIIEQLKSVLPSIQESVPNLKKESSASDCGPCFFCGGVDRFVVKKKDGKEHCWCRHCHPEPMDIIDFHAWVSHTDIKGLARQYLNGYSDTGTSRPQGGVQTLEPARQKERSPEPPDPKLSKVWNDHCSSQTLPIVKQLFCDARGLSEAIIEQLHRAGKLKTKTHAGKLSAAVTYTTIDGVIQAIQYITIDGEPYPFTVKNDNPANKVFLGGSKAGSDCYFFCGADIQVARRLIICESVINAITAYECFPDACCIALGGSTYTKKVKALKPYLDHIEKVIVCGDNDAPGKNMIQAIWKELVYEA